MIIYILKRMVFMIVVIGMLAAISCSKVATPPAPLGSWTFGSNTFQAVSYTTDSATASLTASNTVSGTSYSNMTVSFYDTLPTADSSIYTVVYAGAAPGPKQVTVSVAYMASGVLDYYGSTGGNGKNQKVTVTVNNGKMILSGSNIEIINNTGQYDSTALSFTLIRP